MKNHSRLCVMVVGCFFLIESQGGNFDDGKEEILMMGRREMYMLSYRLYYVLLI